ncbi:MAG: hypothetical protein JSW11_17365 [Candidatus Heimdallarchaeota archaeon]|nr:MAG: hypothetical protein JSW11_17365 [Candidatus Heimdallarchaeota archaeon]
MLLGSKEHLLEIQKRVNENEEYLEMTKGEGKKAWRTIIQNLIVSPPPIIVSKKIKKNYQS